MKQLTQFPRPRGTDAKCGAVCQAGGRIGTEPKYPHHPHSPGASSRFISNPENKKTENLRPVAVLCVSGRSIYKHVAGVLAYDQRADARSFKGGFPVVAHPPCRCWSARLSHQAKPANPAAEMALGLWCVEQVMTWGGVLEHPANSKLWEAAGLPLPGDKSNPFLYTVYLEQGWFGFGSCKPTWILCSGIPAAYFAPMPFSLCSLGNSMKRCAMQRSRTTERLARWLIGTARATWLSHGVPKRSSDLAPMPSERTAQLVSRFMPRHLAHGPAELACAKKPARSGLIGTVPRETIERLGTDAQCLALGMEAAIPLPCL